MMQTVRSVALESFDTAAARYHAGVYGRKRVELLDKLNTALLPSVQAHVKNSHKIVLKDFMKKVQERLEVEGYAFAKVIEGTTKEAERKFEKVDMVATADLLRAEETKKRISNIERIIKSQISETVEMSLNKPSPDMWDRVLSAFRKALNKAEKTRTREATSFNCTPEENETALTLLRVWLALRPNIDAQAVGPLRFISHRFGLLNMMFIELIKQNISASHSVRPSDPSALACSSEARTEEISPLLLGPARSDSESGREKCS